MSAFSNRLRPTDDASTRRWRGSQQTGPVRTTQRSDAQLVDVLDCAVVYTLHALFCTFFLVSAVQKLLKSVKI